MDILFPGSASADRRFTLQFIELPANVETMLGNVTVMGTEVIHASGAPAYALRLVADGKIIGYSSDTEWTEALISVAKDADLFICEAYRFDKTIKNHLDYMTLCKHRVQISCRRLILTHMIQDMLDRHADVAEECAEDGMQVAI